MLHAAVQNADSIKHVENFYFLFDGFPYVIAPVHAFSIRAIYSCIFHSCIFYSRIFSAPSNSQQANCPETEFTEEYDWPQILHISSRGMSRLGHMPEKYLKHRTKPKTFDESKVTLQSPNYLGRGDKEHYQQGGGELHQALDGQ